MALESDPELEFEFFLAEQLGGTTVEELRRRMSNAELLMWSTYYGRKAQNAELAAKKADRGR